ncbi:uncharacterized protein LOC130361716 [Hyla sarda]|uniref:uncharacterized protein LOC130361716 n=1 Tax=Hyla sarda TaxID=327740 RepID=UPI0024C2636C|nr:uncharacterized protein LOC130361716 [Hyla sarda]XP_056421020.1 uncharacterized protein LOC130361716 [Hyla sarda]XP_056421021.1 uncharacterized protein LOC130361716 [Hyla sarda]XP_056421022.1 uncharacterized protein LOC130361716 [Hyla sarda]
MSAQGNSSVDPGQSDDDLTSLLYDLDELLDGVSEAEVTSAADVLTDKKAPVVDQPVQEENRKCPAEEKSHPNKNPYEEWYYMQVMQLSNVLERGLTGISSELNQLSSSVFQLVYGMKECADTMGFYATRMLAFQQEMLNAASKANISLQTGVHLLHELKAKHGPCLLDTCKASNWDGRTGQSDEGRFKRHYRDVQPRSPEDNGSHYSKRDKKK